MNHLHPTGFPWNCGVSAMINGLMGGMSFLYGGGDFRRTVGVAIAAGFDCDNQAATLAGLIGVMHGAKAIKMAVIKTFGQVYQLMWNNSC